ncbi:MAG: trypsin-like peptidase domain-containing protein [Parcubacteria group bacterium]|nr:trypsin-like peptidase domain-containing protein [Parcubacteria group bacterium]
MKTWQFILLMGVVFAVMFGIGGIIRRWEKLGKELITKVRAHEERLDNFQANLSQLDRKYQSIVDQNEQLATRLEPFEKELFYIKSYIQRMQSEIEHIPVVLARNDVDVHTVNALPRYADLIGIWRLAIGKNSLFEPKFLEKITKPIGKISVSVHKGEGPKWDYIHLLANKEGYYNFLRLGLDLERRLEVSWGGTGFLVKIKNKIFFMTSSKVLPSKDYLGNAAVTFDDELIVKENCLEWDVGIRFIHCKTNGAFYTDPDLKYTLCELEDQEKHIQELGYLELPSDIERFEEDEQSIITCGHAGGFDKRMCWINNKIVAVRENSLYYTGQEASIGSPLMNSEGRVIGMHLKNWDYNLIHGRRIWVANLAIRMSRIAEDAKEKMQSE